MKVTLRDFVNNFQHVVNQVNSNAAMKMAKGAVKDMSEYNRHVGRAEGLDQAVQLLRDMLGQIENARDGNDLPEMPQAGQGVPK